MTTILGTAPQIRVEEIHFPTNKISSFQEFASRISTYAAQSIEVIFSPVSALVATIDCLSNNTYALKASVNYNLKVTAKISLLVYSIFSFKTEKTALLQRAMGKEHYDIARYMLYKGVSPITKTPENSPLVIAAENGHVDLINYMLAKAKNHPSQDERQQVEKAALEKVIHKIIQGEGSWEIFHLLTQASLEEANEPVESLFRTHILPIENQEIRNYMALAFFKGSPSKLRFLKEATIEEQNMQSEEGGGRKQKKMPLSFFKDIDIPDHLLDAITGELLSIQDKEKRFQLFNNLIELSIPFNLEPLFKNSGFRKEIQALTKLYISDNEHPIFQKRFKWDDKYLRVAVNAAAEKESNLSLSFLALALGAPVPNVLDKAKELPDPTVITDQLYFQDALDQYLSRKVENAIKANNRDSLQAFANDPYYKKPLLRRIRHIPNRERRIYYAKIFSKEILNSSSIAFQLEVAIVQQDKKEVIAVLRKKPKVGLVFDLLTAAKYGGISSNLQTKEHLNLVEENFPRHTDCATTRDKIFQILNRCDKLTQGHNVNWNLIVTEKIVDRVIKNVDLGKSFEELLKVDS